MEYVKANVAKPELLAGLAEEATELAQAALKYRRALTGDNPTPVPPEEALRALQIELGDVMLYVFILGLNQVPQDAKLERWVYRLKRKEASNG